MIDIQAALTPKNIKLISEALARGNSVEIKCEKNKLVIVEITRKVKNKTLL